MHHTLSKCGWLDGDGCLMCMNRSINGGADVNILLQAQNKREIDEFHAKRAQWRQLELNQMDKENEAILAFAQQQGMREQVRSFIILAIISSNIQ